MAEGRKCNLPCLLGSSLQVQAHINATEAEHKMKSQDAKAGPITYCEDDVVHGLRMHCGDLK